MTDHTGIRADLEAAMADGGDNVSAADRLCVACVELLQVDGAAISLMRQGSSHGTFGSSGELSRRLDALQFTLGEGPCMDAFSKRRPVLVPDMRDEHEVRWPAFSSAALDEGVRAVFALPSAVANSHVGVLDLFRERPGPLSDGDLSGGLMAAQLAALPLLNLMTSDIHWTTAAEGNPPTTQLASLERIEVYQATGMIMEQLQIGPTEALVRLRAHAFVCGQTASEAAWDVVERRSTVTEDDPGSGPRDERPTL